MFRCRVCGAFSQSAGSCSVCGGAVTEIGGQASTGSQSLNKQRIFWTGRIVAVIVVVLVASSGIGAGFYLATRPSGPSCANGALNYPSCNACGSTENYSASTNTCSCANGAVNKPECNRWCANNAINPPACDRCPDNQTDVVCPPGVPSERTVGQFRTSDLEIRTRNA